MKNHITIAVLLLVCIASSSNETNLLWPLPSSIKTTPGGQTLKVNPCSIAYKIESSITQPIQEIIDFYMIQVFRCVKNVTSKVVMNIVVKDPTTMIPTQLKHQKYQLVLRNTSSNRWQLTSDYYVGFLRGFETFTQLFETIEDKQYEVKNLPITIDDAPLFTWRGLMIDSSRHFMPVELIRKAIDGMLYSKLNVMHWHIIDEDSFTFEVAARPQLSQSGSVGGVYSDNEIKGIISYAKSRGIRVIPQIDTPAHTESWGRSKTYSSISMNCNGQYQGQFDPTKNQTYQVLDDVMEYMNRTFSDQFIHFGGDQVVYNCWNKTWINQKMKEYNISDYKGLAVAYRVYQKQRFRKISNKTIIYWANQDIDLPMDNEDFIQWWGDSSKVDRMKGRKNGIILSNYDLTYLDIGFGNRYGNTYGVYQNWRTMYKFNPRVDTVNIVGGQVCMWSQLVNKYNFQQKVMLRAGVLSERLWNDKINIDTNLRNIATRLQRHAERLRSRGYKISPVTVGLCQKDMSICFD